MFILVQLIVWVAAMPWLTGSILLFTNHSRKPPHSPRTLASGAIKTLTSCPGLVVFPERACDVTRSLTRLSQSCKVFFITRRGDSSNSPFHLLIQRSMVGDHESSVWSAKPWWITHTEQHHILLFVCLFMVLWFYCSDSVKFCLMHENTVI